jgi:uncharacterized protein YyaL (SSP411 family)
MPGATPDERPQNRPENRPENRPRNRLALETSPYLLQHAGNPVDWFPWGDEAFAAARVRDVPVFLSIGYAACHWCHVMERESFEDDDLAAFMNEHLVSIKVDREERPDLDGIYMDAVQAMTGQGGWPLSAFLTPDAEPFFAGTYFPPAPAHGMPSFRQVLEGITQAWRDRRDDLRAQAARIVSAIGGAGRLGRSAEPLTPELLDRAVAEIRRTFDPRWGGTLGAPKFPQPMTQTFLLRRGLRGAPEALEMVTLTLDRMSEGGMYDQLGGGFARYATDEAWRVPHFEKMLYDNAQLLTLYTRAWRSTGEARHAEVARETAAYLLREMRDPAGGFWSSQDADAGGVEGGFATWGWDELVELVGSGAAATFGALPAGNWEGTNILMRPGTPLPDERRILFDARERRTRPATDDKVLTAWNALTVVALAEAGRAFDREDWVEAASACGAFLLEHAHDASGRLVRSWRRGGAGGPAFADDHALAIDAFLTLYETTFELRWFEAAMRTADALIALFTDAERGGFFQTGDDVPALLVRPKDLYDNATPGGNSAAADALLRLGAFTGDARHTVPAVDALRLVRDVAASAPSAFALALSAIDRYVEPVRQVAIVGDPAAAPTRALVAEVERLPLRADVVLAVAAPDEAAAFAAIPLLAERVALGGAPTAYVCEGFVCRMPVTDPGELAGQLRAAAV